MARWIIFPVVVAAVMLGSGRLIVAKSMRNWTSHDGAHSTRAELVDATETAVRLRKDNGNIITVPLGTVSGRQPIVRLSSQPRLSRARN